MAIRIGTILVGCAAFASPAIASDSAAVSPTGDAELLACGPSVEPTTLRAIIRVESGGRPYAIYVNGAASQPMPSPSASEATATAESWIARGYSVDLGLMQVNNRNLQELGYSVAQMFDPCTNVRAGATILTADYLSALPTRPDPQTALRAALSAYNTGTFDRGFYNGYVAKFYGPHGAGAGGPIITAAALRTARPAAPPNPYTAQPTVYHRSSNDD
jgi:type IV secretion system protein VirB1